MHSQPCGQRRRRVAMTAGPLPRDRLSPAGMSESILEAAYMNLHTAKALVAAVDELKACQEANAAILDYAVVLAERLDALGEA